MVKFTNEKDVYPGGAVRNARRGKGRYDLIPPRALRRVALVYEEGGRAHGDRNWELGIPRDRLLDSAIRHCYQALEGLADEDHLAQAVWNLLAAIHFEETEQEQEEGREWCQREFRRLRQEDVDAHVAREIRRATLALDQEPGVSYLDIREPGKVYRDVRPCERAGLDRLLSDIAHAPPVCGVRSDGGVECHKPPGHGGWHRGLTDEDTELRWASSLTLPPTPRGAA